MKTVLGLILISIQICTPGFALTPRQEQSVTGSSSGNDPGWECFYARNDARNKATRLCYELGGSGNWSHGRWDSFECSGNWFDAGEHITLSFFCE